jgi:acyl CoA:acetate/3-ketoacid CoA transferase beta subunit
VSARFHDVHRVVTNLAVLDFGGPGHEMRLRSVHPGVSVDDVREQTGFALHTDDVGTSREPDAEELRLLREVLDPKGLRDKEIPQ